MDSGRYSILLSSHHIKTASSMEEMFAKVYIFQDLNNRGGNCIHYMYRGEALFYGLLMDGIWRFGLKDFSFANTAFGRANKLNQFPLKLSPETESHLEKIQPKSDGTGGNQLVARVFQDENEVELEMDQADTK